MLLFYLKETFNSLKRARLSTIVTLSVTFIAIVFVTLSIALVALSQRIDNKLKGNLAVNIFLEDSLSDSEIDAFKERIASENSVKKVVVVSKKEAEKKFIAETGEDFRNILEVNPLPVSLRVTFSPDYLTKKFLDNFVESYKTFDGVDDVVYENTATFTLLNYLNSSKLVVYLISFVLVILAVYLIYSTSLIIINSKLQHFETMKLVGTKISTIKIPIYLSGILLGSIAATLALGLFISAAYFGRSLINEIPIRTIIYLLSISTFCIGIIMGLLGAFFSSKKISLRINVF